MCRYGPTHSLKFLDHTQTDTHRTGLLRTIEQLVAEAATYTKHDKHNRRTSTPSAGFEPVTPAIKRLQTYALGRMYTDIDTSGFT